MTEKDFNFEGENRDWMWRAKRADGTSDAGYTKTKEEAEKNKQDDDLRFDVLENKPLQPKEETKAGISPEFQEKIVIDWLEENGEIIEKGELWHYQTTFLFGVILRKDFLIYGIRYVPNKYLELKPFRYVYALFETSYVEDGIHLSSGDFKKKLAETNKIPERMKEGIYSCYELSAFSRGEITEDEFKNAIKHLTLREKYKVFDKEISKAVRFRKKENIEQADELILKYMHSFKDINSMNQPISLAKKSIYQVDNYLSQTHHSFDTFSERLNMVTGGGWKGETWIVGGYTSDGKTQLAKELAYNAMKTGDNILLVSLEMLEDEMTNIFESRIAYDMGLPHLTLNKIRRRGLNGSEIDDYKKVVAEMQKYRNLFIYQPEGRFTMDDLEMEIDKMMAYMQIDIVVVDYLELIDPDRNYESYRVRVKEIMRRAKRLATRKNIWVIIPHQVSRHGRERADKRAEPHYTMSDLQESSGVEQNCVVMLWIYQNEYYRKNQRAKIGVSKNRMGKLDTKGWEIGTDWEHCRLYEDGINKLNEVESREDWRDNS